MVLFDVVVVLDKEVVWTRRTPDAMMTGPLPKRAAAGAFVTEVDLGTAPGLVGGMERCRTTKLGDSKGLKAGGDWRWVFSCLSVFFGVLAFFDGDGDAMKAGIIWQQVFTGLSAIFFLNFLACPIWLPLFLFFQCNS